MLHCVGKRQGARLTNARFKVVHAAASRVLSGHSQHAFSKVSDGDATARDQCRRGEPWFVSACGNVEKARVVAQVGMLDHRSAKRGEPAEDHPIPLLPAGREPVPRFALLVSDLVKVR